MLTSNPSVLCAIGSAAQSAQWWIRSSSSSSHPIRLFCFPYAGGGPSVFSHWPALLGANYEVYSLSLPGRGARLREPSLCSLDNILRNIFESLHGLLDVPFMFFGHSMGALIAYELARQLHRECKNLPRALFVSGARAPDTPWERKIHDLPKDEFLSEIYRLNGVPEELAREETVIEMFLPALRADFQICETYQFVAGDRLPVPIHVFGGTDDPDVSKEQLQGWSSHTTFACYVMLVQGDHFFINTAPKEVVNRVKGISSFYFQNQSVK